MTPQDWAAKGASFDWRGHSIFYRTDGAGDPLLAIHGFPTASYDYARIWDRLAAKHRVVTLDMIGFGFSAKPRNFRYSIMKQADLYEAFLERERIDRYRILAHDYGNTVAQELLARRRGNIVSVCLLNGGLFPETHRALVSQKLLASPIGSLVARLIDFKGFSANMRRIWGTHHLPDTELYAMWSLVKANDGLPVMAKLIGYIAERKQYRERWVGAIVDAPMPIRLIDGLDDPVSGAHMVARYRELVPHPDIVELPGIGHYPQVEAPDDTVAAILAFTCGAGA
ncbi:MAG TPA: alpha/beta hydrolase [Kofleriaceae bacterium]|nr:alpha/beta hydrolase [Kofleriaceae bacterium]